MMMMMMMHTMRAVGTDGVAWSVCLSVGYVRELCKKG